MNRYAYQQGLSLLELLVTLALMTFLLTVAVPSLAGLLEKTRQDTVTERIKHHLALARIEAISRQQWITLCRTQDGVSCVGDALNGETEWQGLLMFVDTQRQRVPEQPEHLLRVDHFTAPVRVTWNRGDSLTYQPDGSVTGFSNGSFRVQAGSSPPQRLVLALSGRVRHERD